MRKVFLSILLLFSLVRVSEAQEFSKSYTVALNDLTKPCESVVGLGGLYYWRMQWTLQTPNTISGATLSLMGYNTNNCSDTGTEIVAATAATTNGTSVVSNGAFPYIRVVPASFAGTGTISVWVGGSRGTASSGGAAGAVDIDSVGGTPVTTTVPVSCGDCSGTGVSHIDDAAFTPAVTDIVPIGGFFDDVAPDSINEGDAGVVRMSANRNLYSTIRDAAGNERGVNVSTGNALLVDGSATTQPVSGTVTVTDGAGALNVIVDSGTITTVSTITNPVTVTDGAGALNVIIDSGTVTVSDGAGALNVIVDSGTITTVSTITNPVTVTDGAGAMNVICDSGCAGGVQYVEGAAAPADPTGTGLILVRADTPTSNGADGNNVAARGDALGAQYVAGTGTAGTAASKVLTVQGIAAMTPLLVSATNLDVQIGGSDSLTIGTFPDNEPFNIAQMNGVAVTMGNGASGTGVQRVTLASDSTGTLGISTFPDNEPFNIAQMNGVTVLMGNGASGTGAQRVTIANDSTGVVGISTFPDNEPFNLAQMNGVAVTMGDGATGTGVQRVTLANNSTGVVGLNAGSAIVGKFGIDQTTPGTTNAVVPVDTSGNSLAVTDPCDGNAKTSVSFSISSATTTEFVNASASNYIYICGIDIVVGAANNVALVEDDTDTCGSPTAGMAGGVTAATGWNFAANGGLTKGNGGSTVFKSAATNRYGCLMTSGTAQTSGSIQYVLAP